MERVPPEIRKEILQKYLDQLERRRRERILEVIQKTDLDKRVQILTDLIKRDLLRVFEIAYPIIKDKSILVVASGFNRIRIIKFLLNDLKDPVDYTHILISSVVAAHLKFREALDLFINHSQFKARGGWAAMMEMLNKVIDDTLGGVGGLPS